MNDKDANPREFATQATKDRQGVAAIAIFVVLAIVAPLMTGAIARDSRKPLQEGGREVIDQLNTDPTNPGQTDVVLRLSNRDVVEEPEADKPSLVAGSPLDEESIKAVLSHFSTFVTSSDLAQAWNMPAQSLLPPRSGVTEQAQFPPPQTDTADQDTIEYGDVEVIRTSPVGAVEVAPFLSVTFNQPMVALATLEQLAQQVPPITISPHVDGSWHWLGTNTLRFSPAPTINGETLDRFPASTKYTVVIPAEMTSASGVSLSEDYSFEFETPTVDVSTVSRFSTDSPAKLSPWEQPEYLESRPVVVAVFNQLVKAHETLEHIELEADGTTYPIRLARDDEIDQDEAASALFKATPNGRAVALTPTEPLPLNSTVTLRFGAKLGSAEGTSTSSDDSTFYGQTYPKLSISKIACMTESTCRPGDTLVVEMSTSIDVTKFRPEKFRIEPRIEDLVINVSGNRLLISGATQAKTTYTINFPADLSDIYGQSLGSEQTRTIDFGTATPAIFGLDLPLITLDPKTDQAQLQFQTRGLDRLRVQLYEVSTSDYSTFKESQFQWFWDESLKIPFPEIADFTTEAAGSDGNLGLTTINLDEYLPEFGHLVAVIQPTKRFSPNDNNYWQVRPRVVWLQRSEIGLEVLAGEKSSVVVATQLATGQPTKNVEIFTNPNDVWGISGNNGIAEISKASNLGYLVGQRGDDSVIIDDIFTNFTGNGTIKDQLRWHTFDDRGLHQPGETVNIKGWVRKLTRSGDAQLQLPLGTSVSYTASDAFGNTIAEGTAELSQQGGFDVAFRVAEGANLGQGWVNFRLSDERNIDNQTHSHSLQLAEFRRPDFEVKTELNSSAAQLLQQPLDVNLSANYLGGGALAQAPIRWDVAYSTGQYSPPNWSDYSFGIWRPWWEDYPIMRYGSGPMLLDELGMSRGVSAPGWPEPEPQKTEKFEGVTNAEGKSTLRVEMSGTNDGQPLVISASAAVTDINRVELGSNVEALVHSGSNYVGMQSARTFSEVNEAFDTKFIVTDIDGNVSQDREVRFELARLEQRYANGEWSEVGVDEQYQALRSTADSAEVTFSANKAGKYRLSATVEDDQGGFTRTEIIHWVKGAQDPASFGYNQAETLELVPNAPTYRHGETAQVLVQAPFEASEGVYVISRAGIRATHNFTLVDNAATLEIPIEESAVPGFELFVTVAGTHTAGAGATSANQTLTNRPAWANNSLYISVPPVQRQLNVEVTPIEESYTPGASAEVRVSVTNQAGKAVPNAEVTLVAVDEAVLALSGYTAVNPITAMYEPFGDYVAAFSSRSTLRNDRIGTSDFGDEEAELNVAPEDSADMAQRERGLSSAASDSDGTSAGAGNAITLSRSNFDALAIFAPLLQTDEAGQVISSFELPESLTRYRLVAQVAKGPEHFGMGESTLSTGLPLQIRPSAPRFANFGDEFQLPFVLQNQTDQPMQTKLILETDNLEALGAKGLVVEVPAHNRVEVRLPVRTENAGTARFRLSAETGESRDSVEVEIPVFTPATREAFATYGVIDDGANGLPLTPPTNVFEEFGGLEITTSSTALAALADAVITLVDYPLDHSDALASRILSVVALRDVLDAFNSPELPSPSALSEMVSADLARLVIQQNGDGGWPMWRRDQPSDPYRSTQVVHALVEAKRAGYVVNEAALSQGLNYLEWIEQHIPADWSHEARLSVIAYALSVKDQAGIDVATAADSFFQSNEDRLDLEGLARLWPLVNNAHQKTIEREVHNRAVDTAGAVTFTNSVYEDSYVVLASDTRATALVLDALINLDPDSDLIPKVVNGLIGNKRNPAGHWGSVQENSFVLLALKAYFDAFEAESPEFVARVWLGETLVTETEWSGYSTTSVLSTIPMATLIGLSEPSNNSENSLQQSSKPENMTSLVVAKSGVGRLYYRLGLKYAPNDLRLDPRDEGFVVSRQYEAVDNPDDVRQNTDGTWEIKAGANVAVRVTMVAESDRRNVALIDPLPAGLEIINPNFANTPQVDLPEDPPADQPWPLSYRWRWWFDHTNQRDDRAEVFSAYLGAGVYEYRYLARATTPGSFVTPPTRAEEIYAPEVFGRSGTALVQVVATD
ncbi:MAG: Ig-like domain-containing protein [Acidimicrobiia bacterium]